jgi:TonB family protein
MRKILLALLFFGGHVDAQQLTYETAILFNTLPPDTKAGTSAAPELVQQLRRALLGELNSKITRLEIAISTEAVRIHDPAHSQTTVVPRTGEIRSIDSAKRVYWTTRPSSATTAIEGVGARLLWHRTGRMERVGEVDAEEVQFEIEMSPASQRKPLLPADSFIVSGDLWVAAKYQRYAAVASAVWPRAVSVLPTLAELAELGLIVKSAITIDVLGVRVETLSSALMEQPLESELFTVPANFRRVPPPSQAGPRLVNSTPARYTAEAARQKIDGVVLLEVTVRTDGSVTSPRVIKSLGFGLDEAAIESVLKWKYEPARRDGTPVEVQLVVSCGFTYRERPSAPR